MSGPMAPWWAGSGFGETPTVHTIDIRDRVVLFCEQTQALFDLNPTADLIWRKLRQGLSRDAIAAYLMELGSSSDDAAQFATSALEGWMRAGFIAPAEILDGLRLQAVAVRSVWAGSVATELSFFGDADVQAIDQVFGHLASGNREPSMRLAIVGREDNDFIFRDGLMTGMTNRAQTPPAIKALLTEACCRQTTTGFLAHGALVSRGGKRVFLSGEPGAGKTTLTLALTASGFAYCSDDIVHIDDAGNASGIPFAAAAKSGSWRLLEDYLPTLASLPVFQRADGQTTRYVAPEQIDANTPKQLDMAILLVRDAESSARLEAIAPLEALQTILNSGYSERRALAPETLQALADGLSRAACYRLIYSDLGSAVAAIAGVA